MKQIVQDLTKGHTLLVDTPRPSVRPGHVLVRTVRSLISAGTERMLVDFGRAGYLEKARQQPDKVRQVLDKVRTDGLATTYEAVRAKLDQPLPMGYSNVGVVVEVGTGVEGLAPGDRVVSNGHHAEYVVVPRNLCARIPDCVGDDAAAFTVLGAIALQGVRLIAPTLGERVFVSGLGLLGLLAVQILRANGCRVLGADFDPQKLALAQAFGCDIVDLAAGDDPVRRAESFTRGIGIDAVLVTASTKSSEPISQAARMCRKRGRIVLVGVTGLELSRADFYEKELSFQVSCSYGPGRYDQAYEKKGQDYPVGFVRWTEQRNFEAVLDLLEQDAVDVGPLISARHPIGQAAAAYDALMEDRSTLGVILDYPSAEMDLRPGEATSRHGGDARTVVLNPAKPLAGRPTIASIGAGNYAGRVLLPAFARAGARLKSIATLSGLSGTQVGTKLGFEISTTDATSVLDDPEVDAVVVATQHGSHARFVVDALLAGKSVFVEKPLALSHEEINQVEDAYASTRQMARPPILMVGFNRRFSPLVEAVRTEMRSAAEPPSLIYTCNAGAIPADHWTQDVEAGGGRIIGEACHFFDLARHLVGSAIRSISGATLLTSVESNTGDTATFTLSFVNGAIASVNYFANGNSAVAKERLEVFQAGRIIRLDNYRSVRGYGTASALKRSLWMQDKGQERCVKAFIDAVAHGHASPIPFEELIEVARVSVDAANLTK